MLLSVSVAMNGELGREIVEKLKDCTDIVSEKYAHALDIIVLAAFLVQQKQVKESPWKPYLIALPKSYTLPICWKEETIKTLLKGTGLEFITLERIKWLHRCVEHVNTRISSHLFPKSNCLTYEEFLWAFCSITSRAFPKSQTSKKDHETTQDWLNLSEICLYPVLDMLNHKRGQKIEWRMSNEGVSFISQESVREGQEINNNYGHKGNENLLGNYGFVLQYNPEDYFKVVLNTNEQDRYMVLRTKVLAMQSSSISLIHLIFRDDEVVSEKLVRAAEIMVASDVELDLLAADAEFTSSKLRLSALKTLLQLVESKLNLIREPIDASLLKTESENMDFIISIAKTYREGQVKILEHHTSLLEKKLNQLLDSIVCMRMDDPVLVTLKCQAVFKNHESEIDEFTQITLALIELSSSAGTSSIFAKEIQSLQDKIAAESLKRSLKKDFKDFYMQEISPLKKSYPDIFSKELYSKERCFWAFVCMTLLFDDDLAALVFL